MTLSFSVFTIEYFGVAMATASTEDDDVVNNVAAYGDHDVLGVCMRACLDVCLPLCMCVYVYVCVCVCVCAHVCVYVCSCMQLHACVRAYACVPVCIFICTVW